MVKPIAKNALGWASMLLNHKQLELMQPLTRQNNPTQRRAKALPEAYSIFQSHSCALIPDKKHES
jgi:hypothetical protein